MRREYKGAGLVVYEKERQDLLAEAVMTMVRLDAQRLDDETAASLGLGILFEQWAPGSDYTAGTRISDETGALYRVVQAHTAQTDWPLAHTPALYTKLGVTADQPEAVADWVQPSGAQDAYQKGERVCWNGKIYKSYVDENVWTPDVTGWTECMT